MVKFKRVSLPPSGAWVLLFVPALSYFVATRLGHAGWAVSGRAALGSVVTNSVTVNAEACDVATQHLYLTTACDRQKRVYSLKHKLNVVQKTGLGHVVATMWKHDTELGRGYLLLSDAAGQGRVWRWEVGGGPIAIGKTLHIDQSGCRSGAYLPCHISNSSTVVGSGGLAIDFVGKTNPNEGRLVVAEWGEGRIARLEENGARTPLAMHLPSICPNMSSAEMQPQRIQRPSALLYTPFGDLLWIDYSSVCNRPAVFRLQSAVRVEPLESLRLSRDAHQWTSVNHASSGKPGVFYADSSLSSLGGIALTASWTSVYITAVHDGNAVLLRVPLTNNDDVDNDVDESESDSMLLQGPRVAMNLTRHMTATYSYAGSLAVTRTGLVYWSRKDNILLVDPEKNHIFGSIPLPQSATSLTLADDGFLYVATATSLMRMRVKEGPVKVPTKVVI